MILIRTFLDEFSHNETGNEITLIKRKSGEAIRDGPQLASKWTWLPPTFLV